MKRYGLIGRSINNSLSPQIHTSIMRKLGIEGSYQLLEWDQTKENVQGLRNIGLDGFNVTIPYKQWILPYLDELDCTAKLAGAVNTVLREGDKWKGYNTDGDGFVSTVAPYIDTDFRIAVMGTGGAAFGIVSALVHHGYCNLTSIGRSLESTDLLKQHLKAELFFILPTATYDALHPENYDVIINCTSVGMTGADQNPLFDYTKILPRHTVVDIVYKPRLTPLLITAREKGARIIGGLDMLMAQAVIAQGIWQNRHLEFQTFRVSILEEMERGNSEL